jgi:hypothetical protein
MPVGCRRLGTRNMYYNALKIKEYQQLPTNAYIFALRAHGCNDIKDLAENHVGIV